MNISPLQRLVKVTYRHIDFHGKLIEQIEEWTIHQCISEGVEKETMERLLATQTSENPELIVPSGKLNPEYPVSYQLMHEYNSQLACKRTVSKNIIGG